MHPEITRYNQTLNPSETAICTQLCNAIEQALPEAESKLWHAHPVWFIDGNPIVGYSKQKAGIRLMFWSGASFEDEGLNIQGGKFKDASVFYNDASEIHMDDLIRWLNKSKDIQWDYKHIVKRKGQLLRLK